ncbi:uncharacterized protein LOC122789416 [Protopterus annectens]|uniref:uncharacterized protein LOC122789416 n=1 Tax=Protopterus annectens TaxID=7888 RepID=UPI001CFABE5B|nr:uncharacterized protein LOC122789416 [Protopterus annectens]XP_043912790.1 uncharacterized protein LOC122789416 [Protopterus annectens]
MKPSKSLKVTAPRRSPSALQKALKGESRKEQAVGRKRKSVETKTQSNLLQTEGSSVKKKCKENEERNFSDAPLPTKNKKGELFFEDFPRFQPNLTPEDVLRTGSFGGTYFRPIYSSITKQKYKDVWKELPKSWLEGLDIPKQIASTTYREDVNTYKVKCGGSLEMWESKGWIIPQDPYGWFQWYCRFYQGRRSPDDERQIGRWDRCTGFRGRWRRNLITKIVHSGCDFDNPAVSPVVRQTLQHWGYRLSKEDYEKGKKKVKY